MTGEITLRGKVLPIGGVKEKLLAGRRAGVTTIIIPKENEKDLAEIPADVLDTLQIIAVETMDEVLQVALERLPSPRPDANIVMPAQVWQQTPPVAGTAEGSLS